MSDQPHAAHKYDSKVAEWAVLIGSMAGVLMQALDTTIANVALPYMEGSLSASRDQITWVLTSYIIAAAIMTAPVGWMAARFGKKNFLITAIAGFTIASMLCGAAQSLEQMVVFRIIQGMFGAALGPLSQAVMLDMYPPAKRGSVMAIWGMGVMLGPILGPTLGGVLTDAYNWRWVFYINVPFGIAACAMLLVFFKDTARDNTLKFDWFGFGALSVGLAALQLLLDRGTTKDWFSSPEIVIEGIISAIALYLFVVHMITARKPFIPVVIFKDRNFISGLILMFVMGLVLLASSALLSPYLQNLAGRSVTQTGFLMVPRGFGVMFAMMFAGRLTMKMDPRLLMTAGRGAVVLVDVGNDLLDAGNRRGSDLMGNFCAGPGHGAGIRPHEHGGFCDTFATTAHRWRGSLQPDAQYWQRFRRFHHHNGARHQRPDDSCPTRRQCLGVQPGIGGQRAFDDDESRDSFWVGKSEFSHRIPFAGAGLCQRFSFHVPDFPCLCLW